MRPRHNELNIWGKLSQHMGEIMGVIYIATVPDESLGSATWVRRVLGLTLSLLHKSRGTRGLAAKSLYY